MNKPGPLSPTSAKLKAFRTRPITTGEEKLRDAQAAAPAKPAKSIATFLPVALGPLDRPQPLPMPTTVMVVDLPGGIHVRLEVAASDQEAAS